MSNVLKKDNVACSKKVNKPRRKNHNTDLCVDLKTQLCYDRIAMIGKDYLGVLSRDQEFHYTFKEVPSDLVPVKRNPRVFVGKTITITRRDDGTLRPNFKPVQIDADFDYGTYATAVGRELRKALKGLLGRKGK